MAPTHQHIVHGRVFRRLQRFHALPDDLKSEVAMLEKHLMTVQNEVFAKHHTLQLKSHRGVRYKPLLETVHEWVSDRAKPQAPLGNGAGLAVDAVASQPAQQQQDTTQPMATRTTTTTPTTTPANDHALAATTAETEGSPVADATPPTSTLDNMSLTSEADAETTEHERLTRAKRLVDALVLKGFVTPNKEDKNADAEGEEAFDFKDTELLVPLATTITGLTVPATTVWDLVDGALFAATLKRHAGLLAPLTHGKDTYVVVNARARSVTLFESDVAREPIRIFEGALTRVTFDKSQYEHGLKVWDETDAELLGASSLAERDALVAALESVGAKYEEEFPVMEHHARHVNYTTSHTYTVEELTDHVADAVPLDYTPSRFKATYVEPDREEVEEETGDASRIASNTIANQQNTQVHTREASADALFSKHSPGTPATPAASPAATSQSSTTEPSGHENLVGERFARNDLDAPPAHGTDQTPDKALRFEEPPAATTKHERSPFASDHVYGESTGNDNARYNPQSPAP